MTEFARRKFKTQFDSKVEGKLSKMAEEVAFYLQSKKTIKRLLESKKVS
jgi:hypothetical protein